MGTRDPFARPSPERGYGIVLVFLLLVGFLYLVWIQFGVPALEALRSLGAAGASNPTVTPAPTPSMLELQPTDAAFRERWERFDRVVLEQRVARDWTWGPKPLVTVREPYSTSPGGARLVEYYAKGRMEITDPSRSRSDPWFVTSGRLVWELLFGKVELGPGRFEERQPAQESLFGEPMPPRTVTYSSLARALSTFAGIKPDEKVGRPIYEKLLYDGTVEVDLGLAVYDQRYGQYDRSAGHNVAKAFSDFLLSFDLVYEAGQPKSSQVFSLGDIGLALSEPYWIRVTVEGKVQDALVQAFERRVLVYLPESDPPRLRMADSGLHYLAWRYGYRPGQ
jgi:hypothetical protein